MRKVLIFCLSLTTLLCFFCSNKEASTRKLLSQHNPNITLRNAYSDFFPIGTAIYSGFLKDSLRSKFVADQYSSVTPEDQMKPKALQPVEGRFDWAETDKLINFASKHNMKIRGHCLIWFHRMPSWFYKDGSKVASRDLVLKRMKSHITAVMNRYKGKIYCYDVVNEAITWRSDNFFKTEDTLRQIIGEDYIEKAFEYAHEADSSAQLFYNEIWFNKKSKRDDLFEWIKSMKLKGIPIHGIGMQCHLTLKGMEEEFFQETIDMYHSIGVKLQITELDISIYEKPNPKDVIGEPEEYTEQIQERQDKLFEMIFRVCRQNKEKVTGITLWAPYDGKNFLTNWLGKDNFPYLFDKKLKPKSAFYKVTDFK